MSSDFEEAHHLATLIEEDIDHLKEEGAIYLQLDESIIDQHPAFVIEYDSPQDES